MNDIYRLIIWILCVVGGATIIMISIFVISWLVDTIPDHIRKWKHKYEIKHRFDKPPTAKCYCIDCQYHDNETGECRHSYKSYYTSDESFCWEAEPRIH